VALPPHEHLGDGNTLTKPRCGAERIRRVKLLEAAVAGTVSVVVLTMFVGGVIGVIVVLAVAIRREDRRYSLSGEAPSRVSRGVRRLTGVGRRPPTGD
jgi:hypothetical protein